MVFVSNKVNICIIIFIVEYLHNNFIQHLEASGPCAQTIVKGADMKVTVNGLNILNIEIVHFVDSRTFLGISATSPIL